MQYLLTMIIWQMNALYLKRKSDITFFMVIYNKMKMSIGACMAITLF